MKEKLEAIRKELIRKGGYVRDLETAEANEHRKTIQVGYERYLDGMEDALKAVAALIAAADETGFSG